MRLFNLHKNLIDFAISSLLRRKAKNLFLFAFYTLLIFILSSVIFFTEALKREALLVLKEAPDLVVQRQLAGRQELIPVSYGERIKKLRGVGSVRARLWGYYFDQAVGINYTLIVPEEFPYRAGEVAIGKGLSRTRKAYQGDIMPFRAYNGGTVNLKVKEVLPSESELVASDLILISENDFRSLFGIPQGMATDLAVMVRNQKEVDTVAEKIKKLFPEVRVITKKELSRTYEAIFSWRSGILLVLLFSIGLAFIILAWDKATHLSDEEKREIGILKALGWDTSEVLLLKFYEGCLVSLSAFLSGIILGYLQVFIFQAVPFEAILKGWSILYPRYTLIPQIDHYQILLLFSLTVPPYLLATLIPCWRVATIDPDLVMR